MGNNRSRPGVPARSGAAGSVGAAERTFAGLLLWMLVRSGEAMAGEQPALPGNAAKLDLDALAQPAPPALSKFALPATYRPVEAPAAGAVSTREFRPRGRSLIEPDFRVADVADVTDAPLLRGTSVWQNLAEFRSRDGVRVVTLWQSSASSISLQAGRKGNPSLQWTSRFMNRGGATRGILDQLFATSLDGFTHGLHLAPHAGVGALPKAKSALAAETDLAGGHAAAEDHSADIR